MDDETQPNKKQQPKQSDKMEIKLTDCNPRNYERKRETERNNKKQTTKSVKWCTGTESK